jgi:F0F1-type ATP synthase alpha subunit
MRSSLTRAVAGVAIASAAIFAVASSASAATTVAKAHTTLSIVESKSTIKAGQKDLVAGTLKAGKTGLAKEIVLLDRVSGKKLIPVAVELTGKAGNASFTVAPKTTTKYELVFLGTKKLAASHSGVVTVVVKK